MEDKASYVLPPRLENVASENQSLVAQVLTVLHLQNTWLALTGFCKGYNKYVSHSEHFEVLYQLRRRRNCSSEAPLCQVLKRAIWIRSYIKTKKIVCWSEVKQTDGRNLIKQPMEFATTNFRFNFIFTATYTLPFWKPFQCILPLKKINKI